jgi:hypothetical protein
VSRRWTPDRLTGDISQIVTQKRVEGYLTFVGIVGQGAVDELNSAHEARIVACLRIRFDHRKLRRGFGHSDAANLRDTTAYVRCQMGFEGHESHMLGEIGGHGFGA